MKYLQKRSLRFWTGMTIWLGFFLAPIITFAQVTFDGPTYHTGVTASSGTSAPVTSVQGLINLLCRAFDYMFYFLLALALIMGLVAAFNYVTAGDNAEKVSKANKIILYTAIAVAVALLARGLPLIVGSFFGVTSGLTSC